MLNAELLSPHSASLHAGYKHTAHIFSPFVPAKAGTQRFSKINELESRFRGNDGFGSVTLRCERAQHVSFEGRGPKSKEHSSFKAYPRLMAIPR